MVTVTFGAGLAQRRQLAGSPLGGGPARARYRLMQRIAGVELRDRQLPQVLVQVPRAELAF